jgi:hypothetical protein
VTADNDDERDAEVFAAHVMLFEWEVLAERGYLTEPGLLHIRRVLRRLRKHEQACVERTLLAIEDALGIEVAVPDDVSSLADTPDE